MKKPHPHFNPTFAKPALLLLALSAATADAAILLNDTFSDNERANQNLTSSAEWAFSNSGASNTNSSLSASTGQLVYTATTSSAQSATAYFTPSGSPISLADGETITLSFDFAFSSIVNSDQGLRFGIFNSGSTRFASGFSGTKQPLSNAAINAPTIGYFAYANPGGAPGTFAVREEFTSGATPFSAGGTVGTNNTSANFGLVANTTYTALFSITRSGANAIVSSTINGLTQTGTDTGASAGFAYDEISIFTSSAVVPTAGTFTIDNVNVTVVPETSAALLGGLGALSLLRRRRNA